MEEMEVLEIEIDKDLKEQAEAILREMGMDLETAIILFIEELKASRLNSTILYSVSNLKRLQKTIK